MSLGLMQTYRIKKRESKEGKTEDEKKVPILPVKDKPYKEKLIELFGPELNKRKDGRSLDDHRLVYMKTKVVWEAEGSSYLEMGKTKLVCTVTGPFEVRNPNPLAPEGTIRVRLKFSHPSKKNENESPIALATMLKSTLSSLLCLQNYINYVIKLTVVVLESDGGIYPAALLGLSLAAADARLPMYDLGSGITIGLHDNLIIMDLTAEEEDFLKRYTPPDSKPNAIITLSYSGVLNEVGQYRQVGHVEPDTLQSIIQSSITHCQALTKLQQQALGKDIKKALDDPDSDLHKASFANKKS